VGTGFPTQTGNVINRHGSSSGPGSQPALFREKTHLGELQHFKKCNSCADPWPHQDKLKPRRTIPRARIKRRLISGQLS